VEFDHLNPEKQAATAPCFIPAGYMPTAPLRIEAYRKISEVANLKELKKLTRNWIDRFGPFPNAVENLVTITEMRLASLHGHMDSVEVKDGKLMVQRRGDFILVNGKFPRLTAQKPSDRLREIVSMLKS
jgi:transcription-repair coupling factor (superfamily II helicase)